MRLPDPRIVNAAGAAACAAMLAYALYAQYQLLLDPCPLCVLQRIAVLVLGAVLLTAALHGPSGWGRGVYAGFIAVVALAGAGVAAWHVRLQTLPPDEVPACGPGLDYLLDTFPLGEALKLVFSGSGECATVDWRLLGLSMPAWVLIGIAVIGAVGTWNNLRRA